MKPLLARAANWLLERIPIPGVALRRLTICPWCNTVRRDPTDYCPECNCP